MTLSDWLALVGVAGVACLLLVTGRWRMTERT
jgi:hypothetical protein